MTTTETEQAANPGNVAVITNEPDGADAPDPDLVQDVAVVSNGEEASTEPEELDLVFQYLWPASRHSTEI